MTEQSAAPPTNVVPLHPAPASRSIKTADAKWGAPVMQLGYCMIPSLLLRAQHRLKLKPIELAVLLQLCDFWWDEARKPYPSKDTISLRLGMKPRQVQRHIAALEAAGLVQRVERWDPRTGGRDTNIYDLSGLVKRLGELAPEFQETEQAIRRQRTALHKPGLRRRTKAAQEAGVA